MFLEIDQSQLSISTVSLLSGMIHFTSAPLLLMEFIAEASLTTSFSFQSLPTENLLSSPTNLIIISSSGVVFTVIIVAIVANMRNRKKRRNNDLKFKPRTDEFKIFGPTIESNLNMINSMAFLNHASRSSASDSRIQPSLISATSGQDTTNNTLSLTSGMSLMRDGKSFTLLLV
jgi:hypothetical protein